MDISCQYDLEAHLGHIITYEPRSDKRDLLAIKVKSEIFIEKERPSCF